MRQATDIYVHEIYDKAWKFGEIDPLPKAVPLERFLQVIAEDNIFLHADEGSELEGGPYDGGHVITVETRDRPMYFMTPPEAIPMLRPHMRPSDYEELVKRTPRLRRSK